MLFCTFQSLDYSNKPVLVGDEIIPHGIFKNDVSKGVVWCMPITKNYKDSIVNAWMSCPNFAQVFIMFDSDDYHKIDKIKWYQDLAKKEQGDFWNYIDDNVEDNYAEYVVPYSEISDLSNIRFLVFIVISLCLFFIMIRKLLRQGFKVLAEMSLVHVVAVRNLKNVVVKGFVDS